MEASTVTENSNLQVFTGSRPYVEIATREGAILGLFVSSPLVKTQDGSTNIFLAFAARNASESEFKHFKVRGDSNYLTEAGEVSPGVRLNKVIIPVFDKPVSSLHFGAMADKFGVFDEIGKWLNAQISAEGFVPLVFNCSEYLRSVFSVEPPPEDVQLILSLPDFEGPETVDIPPSEEEDEVADPEGEEDEDTDISY